MQWRMGHQWSSQAIKNPDSVNSTGNTNLFSTGNSTSKFVYNISIVEFDKSGQFLHENAFYAI